MSGAVEVNGLGKAYRHYPGRWSRLAEWLLPWGAPRHRLGWALRDVSFSVERGDALGIIGFNGAGKSTLLKIIAGTTQATEGSVRVAGEVSALLELGTGFHPEFTGRQNVYMVGQLRGLQREQLDRLLPSIEEFAEIGSYFDEPLRTYSSGMAVRLAFSVATAQRPEVLIIDEALSVGDAYFQHKSFGRIREFREQGTTLLIVSHDRLAVQSLCDHAILLHQGRLLRRGETEDVLDYYHALMAERTAALIRQQAGAQGVVQTRSGSGEVELLSVWLENGDGLPVEAVKVGEPVTLCVRFRTEAPVASLVVGVLLRDRFGQEIYGINSHRLGMPIGPLAAGQEGVFRLAFEMNLGEAHYAVTVALTRSDSHLDHTYEWRDRALIFHVLNTAYPKFVGRAWLRPEARIEMQAGAGDV